MKRKLRAALVAASLAAVAFGAQAADMTFNAVLYAPGEKVDLHFEATERVPKSQLDGTVKVEGAQAGIELKYSKMEPALLFGGDVNSWVVWVIAPDGTLENLGELPVREDRSGSVKMSTKQLHFAMFVTAEPFPYVRVPSDLVAFVSQPVKAKQSTNSTFEFGNFRTEIKRDTESIAKMKYKDKTPVELQQARAAVQLLDRYGAEKYAQQPTRDARTALAQAEDALAGRVGKKENVPTLSQRTLTLANDALRETRKQVEAEQAAALEKKRQEQIAGLEKQSATAEQARAATAAELSDVQAQRTKLEADVARLAADRKTLEAERDKVAHERDQLQARLSGALGQVAEVDQTARGLVLNLSGEILFDVGKSMLKPDAKMRLAKLSGILLMMGDSHIDIEGHTDSTGSEETNLKLSRERAAAVGDFLVTQGIAQTRMTTKGLGPADPVASNDTAEGRAKNRRVEIVLANPATGG
jgi:outer membrane protein OmpA-like peptidoglycan-associated protein